MAGRFDADAFLKAEYTEALDTERTLFPQGECVGQGIEDVKIHAPKPFTDANGNQQLGNPQIELKILVREDYAQKIRSELGYAEDKPVYFVFRTWLDVTDGYIDFGPNKNIGLGQIREAVGQNEPGVSWSLLNLRGAGPIGFTVKHEEWEKDGKKGTSERVTRWASVD